MSISREDTGGGRLRQAFEGGRAALSPRFCADVDAAISIFVHRSLKRGVLIDDCVERVPVSYEKPASASIERFATLGEYDTFAMSRRKQAGRLECAGVGMSHMQIMGNRSPLQTRGGYCVACLAFVALVALAFWAGALWFIHGYLMMLPA
jgi:hypothetical protein